MSDNGPEFDGDATDLEAAIAENPKAVADFIERLDAVNELLDVVDLGTTALTDEMVRSLASTGSSLGELADMAAKDDTRDGIRTLLESLGAAERAETVPVGPLGLIKAIRDPEIRQGIGYLLAVAKTLGRLQSRDD